MLKRCAAVLAVGAVMIGAACAPGAPAPGGTRSGVSQVQLTYTLTDPVGSITSGTGIIDQGSVAPVYTSASMVASYAGSVGVAGTQLTFALTAALGSNYSGYVRVARPSVVDRVVQHNFVPVTFDGDGDASATATDSGWTLTWSTETNSAAGLESVYDSLTSAESAYCQDAQQRLAGLSEAQVPLASIGNTTYVTRASFTASKATLTPLATQTWGEPAMVTTGAGNVLSVNKLISCKGRNGDHIATTGVTTLPEDNQCTVLTQRSLDLAWAELTLTQRTAFLSSSVSLTPGADVVRSTGVDWTTPIPDSSVAGSAVTINAHALQTRWNDPAFAIFPDNIRGVHYCTTWTPAYAYWWYTVGAFTL